jgi:hypothetical protein
MESNWGLVIKFSKKSEVETILCFEESKELRERWTE